MDAKFKRGDRIVHIKDERITGIVVMDLHASIKGGYNYLIYWEDHKHDGTHTQGFIEAFYDFAD